MFATSYKADKETIYGLCEFLRAIVPENFLTGFEETKFSVCRVTFWDGFRKEKKKKKKERKERCLIISAL